MIEISTTSIASALIVLFPLVALILVSLRRVVPTNMVHIVQSSKQTTPYGRGKLGGNTYYHWPSWVPIWGVAVSKFPESNFQVDLKDYAAYDAARLPFEVDVTAFFRIEDASLAAQRVSTFDVLVDQLRNVVQGSVRSVLATNKLEDIMQARSTLADAFTAAVDTQLAEWGVKTVKTIEFMDIRDSANNKVIDQIMAREKARIDRQSREEVAEHNRAATEKEIAMKREIDLQQQNARQQVGMRNAETEREVGIAEEKSRQAIAFESVSTARKDMEVQRVRDVQTAEISRDVAVVRAEENRQIAVVAAHAEKEAQIAKAEGDLISATREAEGVTALGAAKASAEQAMQVAPVEAQIKLAKEIGGNAGYQEYLIRIEQVRSGKDVGMEMARAMQQADLKVIANSGDMQNGVASLGDMFTPAGGTRLTGMLAALAQTPEGAALIEKLGVPLVAGKAIKEISDSATLGAVATAAMAHDTITAPPPAATVSTDGSAWRQR
ncbi:SPFH domain-containing protein [Achromobacter spanius]|jgi:flotillin|uniref:SPFH domain-containing protein n=1 Tax=Achromobacter spanius TaxID=217203 RepID=A0AA42LPP7_9BURK|nr:SPFH domain-containing protein [Achromobacter spanius]MDH0737207.1 SPFH domain-containing protein [Achromobacter spanius]